MKAECYKHRNKYLIVWLAQIKKGWILFESQTEVFVHAQKCLWCKLQKGSCRCIPLLKKKALRGRKGWETTSHMPPYSVYLALAVGNDKSISYSSTHICFMWEEKPLEPFSSTHCIQSESLCTHAVWINPPSLYVQLVEKVEKGKGIDIYCDRLFLFINVSSLCNIEMYN